MWKDGFTKIPVYLHFPPQDVGKKNFQFQNMETEEENGSGPAGTGYFRDTVQNPEDRFKIQDTVVFTAEIRRCRT
jgi:hypothetical protein